MRGSRLLLVGAGSKGLGQAMTATIVDETP